jgi:hypothetical protein
LCLTIYFTIILLYTVSVTNTSLLLVFPKRSEEKCESVAYRGGGLGGSNPLPEIPNYSCLQNPWLGGHCPQIPVLSALCPQLNLSNPSPNKIPGYATDVNQWESSKITKTAWEASSCLVSTSYMYHRAINKDKSRRRDTWPDCSRWEVYAKFKWKKPLGNRPHRRPSRDIG